MRHRILNAYDAWEKLSVYIGTQKPTEMYYLISVAHNQKPILIDTLCAKDEIMPLERLYRLLRVYPPYVILARNSWYLTPLKQDEDVLSQVRNELEPKIEVADLLVFNQRDYLSYREDYLISAPAIPYTYRPKRVKHGH